MIIAEHPSESFAPFDCGMRSANDDQRLQQAILESLMIPLAVVMGHELRHRVPQRCVPEEDHPTQAFFFDGTDKSFRERVQIR